MILESIGLTKIFRMKPAVLDFNVKIEKGRIYGLLGPNGSGKTTWMKMAAGLTKPTKGMLLFEGEPWNYKNKAKIAYMSTEPFFYEFMTVKDVGEYYNDFFEDFDLVKFKKLIKENHLDEEEKAKHLSSGMNAKLKIIATLSRKAELFLLDEPLNGIDIKAREEIVNMIIESSSDENAIVISTHLLDEIESFMDEAIFVKEGKIIRQVKAEETRMEEQVSMKDIYMQIM